MTRADVIPRQAHAHAFLGAADLVLDLGHDAGMSELGNTLGSLAVLAGIAAGDAIAGATLKLRSAGENHAEAVALLRESTQGRPLAASLQRLIGVKTETQYSTAMLSEARAKELLQAARRLVNGMDEILRALA